MYLGELVFDLAAPPIRRCGQVPHFLGEKLFALQQRGRARRVGRRWEHFARWGHAKNPIPNRFGGTSELLTGRLPTAPSKPRFGHEALRVAQRSRGGQARGDSLLGLQRLDQGAELIDFREQVVAPRPRQQIASNAFKNYLALKKPRQPLELEPLEQTTNPSKLVLDLAAPPVRVLRALSPSERLGRRTFEGLNIDLTAAHRRTSALSTHMRFPPRPEPERLAVKLGPPREHEQLRLAGLDENRLAFAR
jgi:hypothetical protein